MKLPIKIEPDRIRDSIVQIFFKSEIPFEPLIGYFYEILSKAGFAYTNAPVKPQQKTQISGQANEFMVNILPQHLFFNEEIKIQLHQSGSIIFNCINKYIGWNKFFAYINDILLKLKNQNVIYGFQRIGIRYISEFPNIDLSDKLNFSYRLEGLNESLHNGNFRFEWNDDPYKIVVNLGIKLPILISTTVDNIKIDYISLIDIDVIQQGFNIVENEELCSVINSTHIKQKRIFFTLLKEEFLQTLNPIYEL